MIEGLKVTVPGTDVRTLLEERAQYHDVKAEKYRQQLAIFNSASEGNDELSPKLSNDPRRDLEHGRERHENGAKEMRFMAKFINTSEIFLLDQNDLTRLGVLHSRY